MAEVVDHEFGVPNSEISIMVCGKSGIGKSTLLNILLGMEGKFAVAGPGDDENDSMEAGTKDLISVSETIHGIKVTMYDTPGLQPDTSDNYFADSMDKMKTLVKEKIDLVLFCIEGLVSRWATEAKTVKNLHSCFGNELWMNAIFVLTKSNVSQPGMTEGIETLSEKATKCERAATTIFSNFKKQLLKEGVPEAIVDRIPLIAAGSKEKRKLLFVAPNVHDEDFLPELWSLAVKRCRKKSTVPFFIVSNYKQGRFILPDQGSTSLTPEEQAEIRRLYPDESLVYNPASPSSLVTNGTPYPEPIVLNERQTKRVQKALSSAIYGVLGGIGVGASVATACTLTLTVVGGPIGTGVGLVVGLGLGVVTGLIVYKIRKNQEKKLKEQAENIVN